MTEITPVTTAEHIEDARALFRDYEAWLGMSLCFQSFEEEVAGLPGKYAPPSGRLTSLTAMANRRAASDCARSGRAFAR